MHLGGVPTGLEAHFRTPGWRGDLSPSGTDISSFRPPATDAPEPDPRPPASPSPSYYLVTRSAGRDDHLLDELHALLRRPWWHQFAACRRSGPARFFSVGPSSAEALAICATCPVEDECRTTALEDSSLRGVWGGTTDLDRRRLRAPSA